MLTFGPFFGGQDEFIRGSRVVGEVLEYVLVEGHAIFGVCFSRGPCNFWMFELGVVVG